MKFFNDANEALRRQQLKNLEDARLRLAERLKKDGFAPGEMIAVASEHGGVIALCRENEKFCLIVGPDFGEGGEFQVEWYDSLPVTREEYSEPVEGLGGVLGMGRKGTTGFILTIERGEDALKMPFLTNRSSGAVWHPKRNPLLSAKRRRGNANVVWDMMPVGKKELKTFEEALTRLFA